MQAQQKQECTLIWFRNDLRIHDNELLHKAIETNKYLIAFYVFDSVFFEKQHAFIRTGNFRTNFLIETVKELQKDLELHNIPLFVFTDTSKNAIKNLLQRFSILSIIYQEDNTFDEFIIENEVLNELPSKTNKTKVSNQYLYTPPQVDALFKNGFPKSFSSFRKKVEKKLVVEKLNMYQLPKQQKLVESVLEFPTFTAIKNISFSAFPFKGGENEAIKRVDDYFFKTEAVKKYKLTRNELLGINYSTKFSPWLANGSLSARYIYWKLKEFEHTIIKNSSTYWVYFELLWRDFFKHTARQNGSSIFKSGGIQQTPKSFKSDKKLIQNWMDGKTQNDFVNANMIELKKTGWMSNRGRQNVASYFIHNLQQDWSIGAAYFESLLIDYDAHSNYCNWLYIAGLGNDGRSKKFDVDWQANTYDINEEFRTKWNTINE